MAKIGSYKYPNRLDPEEAIKITEKLVNTFNGSPSSKDSFAQSIGHKSSNSGAFMQKVSDLRKYGIIKKRGLEATKLAEKIIHPKNDAEKKKAQFEMMKNIPLFNKLYKRLDGQEPEGDLWVHLNEITGSNSKKAKDNEEKISKLYKRMLTYSKVENKKMKTQNSISEMKTRKLSSTSINIPIYVKIKDSEMKFGELNEQNLDLILNFVNNQKDILKNKSNSKDNTN